MNLEKDVIRQAVEQLGLAEVIVEYLYKRGYRDLESMRSFLMPDNNFVSVFTLKDAQIIVDRVNLAVQNKENVLIFGDYDCDGICATSVLQIYFDSVGFKVRHFIPRRQDGYGLSVSTLQRIFDDDKPDLVITVDCGISAVEEVAFCKQNGVDIIITDHHEPQAVLPDCLILNPKLTALSPLRDICGCAVAYKLVEGLAGREESDKYLDIVALATVADVVPLVGENRKLVYYGLQKLNTFSRAGVRFLCQASDLKYVTSSDIGFRLAPRINALGRLNDETDVVNLFTETDVFFIKTLVEKIDKANKERQNVTKNMLDQCFTKITPQMLQNNKILVLWDKDWETGVLGLVAARLTANFYRPCILLGNGGDHLKGSARSIAGVNIFKCIEEVADLTLGFGGHAGAAGMTLDPEKVEEFSVAINKAVENHSKPQDFIPDDSFDILLSKGNVDLNFCRQLAMLEPFGEGNPAPVFGLNGSDCRIDRLGNSAHIKGRLNSETDVIAFSKEYILDLKKYGLDFQMTVDASIKEFKNRQYVQLLVDKTIVKDYDALKDNYNAFALYSKTAVYQQTDDGNIDFIDDFNEDFYGTIFLAFSQETFKGFVEKRKREGKNILTRAVLTEVDPISCVLLYPENLDNIKYYKNIVLLDTPLSSGYIRMLKTKAPLSNIYCVKNYPFIKEFKSLDITTESIEYTAKKISDHLRSGRRSDGINELFYDLFSFGYTLSNQEFTLHFYVLYEVGWLRVGQGFSLACYGNKPELERSRILKVVKKLIER